jgi:hypothetical protein
MDEGGEPQMLCMFRCAPARMTAVEVVAAHAPNGFRFSLVSPSSKDNREMRIGCGHIHAVHCRHLRILHGDVGIMLSELSIISWPLQASPTNVMSD